MSLCDRIKVKQYPGKIQKFFKTLLQKYSHAIVKVWPVFLIVNIVVVAACGIPTFLTEDLPDFKDPIKGFETRGTDIMASAISQKNLQESDLSVPSGLRGRKKRSVIRGQNTVCGISNTNLRECFNPRYDLSSYNPKMCWKAKDNDNLFQLKYLKDLCKVGHKYFFNVGDYSTCDCEIQSLPVYIAHMEGLSECSSITEKHVQNAFNLLKTCSSFYHTGLLNLTCANDYNCFSKLPPPCNKYSKHIFNIFHYLTDKDFFGGGDQTKSKLSETLLIGRGSGDSLAYFKNHANGKQEYNELELVGLDLEWNSRQEIFNEYMLQDISYIGIGLGIILILVILYLKSFVLMIAIIFQISFSFVLAYFLYYKVFNIPFFPFMNLLGVIILVAVGTDDVFVFYDVYLQEVKFLRGQAFSCKTGQEINKVDDKEPDKDRNNEINDQDAKKEKNLGKTGENLKTESMQESLETSNTTEVADNFVSSQKDLISNNPESMGEELSGDLPTYLEIDEVMYNTFKHAISSICITSLTTATAFYASVISDITSIKGFGVFCGTAILCNLLFMVTWIPAVVMGITFASRKIRLNFSCIKSCCKPFEVLSNKLSEFNKKIFCQGLPYIVLKLRYVWIITFFLLGTGGLIITFITPKLKLPISNKFQLLKMEEPIEAWVHKYSTQFNFVKENDKLESRYGMPLNILFGVEKTDNGNYFNPNDKGKLSLNNKKLFTRDMQQTYDRMCAGFKSAEFLSNRTKNLCDFTLRQMKLSWASPCKSRTRCCGMLGPTYPEADYEYCLLQASQYRNLFSIFQPLAKPNNKHVSVINIRLEMRMSWTSNYDDMDKLYKSVKSFWEKNVGDRGFFVSYFEFYDLQKSLGRGTYISLGISIGFAFGVMLFTTLNLFITLYAIVSIGFAIFTTIGILVLIGWELNILESVAISLAVGLSIDFPIHYGVSYVLSECSSRQSKVRESFRRVGSSVAMAAMTTIIAGLSVLPSRAYSYFQLGLFLVLVMIASWLYATFFFQSLCSTIGPDKNFLKLSFYNRKTSNYNSNPDPKEMELENNKRKDFSAEDK